MTADEWIPAIQGLTERTSLIIRNLTTGDKLQFRVRAYNMAGPSPAATLAQPVTIREIMRECPGRDVLTPSSCSSFQFILLLFVRTAKDLAPEEPSPDPHPEGRGHG